MEPVAPLSVDYFPVPPSFPDVFLKWIKYFPVFKPGCVLYPLRQLAKGRIYFLLIYTCLPCSLSPGGHRAVSPCQSGWEWLHLPQSRKPSDSKC